MEHIGKQIMLDHSSQGRRFIWIKSFKSLKRLRRYFPTGKNPFEVDNQQKSAFIRRSLVLSSFLLENNSWINVKRRHIYWNNKQKKH